MAKRKQAKYSLKAPGEKQKIDGELPAEDTVLEGSQEAAQAAAVLPEGLNPGSGGQYQMVDGKRIRVTQGG